MPARKAAKTTAGVAASSVAKLAFKKCQEAHCAVSVDDSPEPQRVAAHEEADVARTDVDSDAGPSNPSPVPAAQPESEAGNNTEEVFNIEIPRSWLGEDVEAIESKLAEGIRTEGLDVEPPMSENEQLLLEAPSS